LHGQSGIAGRADLHEGPIPIERLGNLGYVAAPHHAWDRDDLLEDVREEILSADDRGDDVPVHRHGGLPADDYVRADELEEQLDVAELQHAPVALADRRVVVRDGRIESDEKGRITGLGMTSRQTLDIDPENDWVMSTLPLARLAYMGLRPRTEHLWDAVPIRWWEWRQHPAGSLFAIFYGLLDAALLAFAVIGFLSRRVPFAAMLAAYLLFRCLLLATMENAEPRYTLEAFPMVIVAAALAMTPRPKNDLEPG